MNFNLSSPFYVELCGFFEAPDERWFHFANRYESYELFYVTDGIMYMSDNGIRYAVKAGEYLVTSPGAEHYGWKSSRCSFYWLHFFGGEGGRAFANYGSYANREKFIRYFSIIQESLAERDIAGSVFQALMCELVRREPQFSGGNALCAGIRDYISKAQADELTVKLIAERFNYSEKYISSLFRRCEGISLKDCIKDEIMKRAKYMLENGGLSLGAIAAVLGYADVHSFSHGFKNYFGLSPRNYRADRHENLR